MLFISLILLLLSNSITFWRDKSILYSRATITILLISAFTTYDNLYFLFLNKGTGIFGGLFHATSTTGVFHIFIFLITSVILLLTSFYPRKVWLKEYFPVAKLLKTHTSTDTGSATYFSWINYKMAILFGIRFGILFGIWFYSVSIYNLGGSIYNLGGCIYNLGGSLSNVHFWTILLFLYSQKHNITRKKLTSLIIIVLITPWVLNILIFSIPYLLDILLVIYFEFYHVIHIILGSFFSKVYEVLLKIFSKKGFIDILTNICICYVIRLVFLGSLSLLDIISNVFFTNCLFSLTIDFYSITLMKVVTPYVENISTSIISPIYKWCFPPIYCDSPKEAIKLFKELPFFIVDSDDMKEECRTSTNNKSREYLREEFKAFRLKMSVFTPNYSVFTESGHESSIKIDEPSRGQLDKGKKRALDNTQQEAYNKRPKIDLGNTKSTTITMVDLQGEDWNLHSIYEKINNIMEDPKFNTHWTIKKLFESKEVQINFYRYIENYPLTTYKNTGQTKIMHLKSNIEQVIKPDDYSIKQEDFKDNTLNLPLLYEKLSKILQKNDINYNSKLAQLKFYPCSLRSTFYEKLKALNFNPYGNVSSLTISSLRNKIADRLNISHGPISWDDFTSDGLNLESLYNKIKLHLENNPNAKWETISTLFLPSSTIAKSFYVKLINLNLTSQTNLSTISGVRLKTLLNSLEKVVDVPSTKDNSITREDLIGEDWDFHSIYEKITNVIRTTKNFNKLSTLSKLEFEPPILRREFYNYIKVFQLTNVKTVSKTRIIFLQERLKQEIEIPDD